MDSANLMQPFANWEEYLTPASLSIAVLGELVFISSSTDFSISKNPPKDGYKLIRYPDSFRACLMQVCNSGWWAFNETHMSMDQIRLQTAQVPDYMKTAVKILFQDDDEVVKAHLPDQLDNIRETADKCLELSDATEKHFNDVTNIIQELLEACVNAEHFHGEELEAMRKKLEESKLREQSALKTKKRTKKAVSAIEKELEQAHESYTKAQLNKTYEKCLENLVRNQKELTEILVTMRDCELKDIDFKTTIEILIRGMDAMRRVKEQWEKMVHFFQMVSNIVKFSLTKTLTSFFFTSEKIQALSYNAKLFSKDLLYTQAFQACNITSLVHMISGTYTDVSNKYLMDRVSSLGKLMAMDKSRPEFRHERQQLQSGCDEAQKGILRLVLKNKEEFDKKSTARLERIGELLTCTWNRKVMDSANLKSTQGLTTVEDMRNETQLMMQLCANWEDYLTPAPPSIAILGELIFISSTTDFSVCKNPPKDGYKFIKYPDSFYTCLMQVCNSGWWAFNETHKSMDQIRLQTAQVPDYVKSAVKILFQDDDEVVKAHLSDQLENIREIADKCLELSDATEKRFTDVINIIQELLEACVNAKHFYGEEMEAMRKKLEESKLREESALETKKNTEKAVRAMEEELEEAHESYRKAQLNKTRETYEKCVENLEKNQKELTEVLVTMRNCELKKINFKTTIEMLVKGMDATGRVKEKWEKMIHFFQMVSFILKTSLSKILTKFVSTSEKTQALSYNAKLITIDLLYTQAFQACNIASLVHMISGTYTDVSNKYLMDHVSSLGKLMVIDKSKPEFDHERQQLQISCDEAQRGILRFVLKNKKEFDRQSTKRLERINQDLLAVLPDAPPMQNKRLFEIGFTEEEASYY